jgi:hypothetical protein
VRYSPLVVAIYCTLLATFEQSVGNAKQDLVSRLEIWACRNNYDSTTTIKVVEQVVVVDTEEKVGAPRKTYLQLPKVEPSNSSPGPPADEGRGS